MSVALGGGGGGGGYMPMAQAAMPRMNAPNYNTSSTANTTDLRMPGMSGPAESSKNLRGDKSGDECLTFDSEEVVLSATWNETSCECVVSTIGSPFNESGEPIDYVGNTIRQLQLAASIELASREADAAKKSTKKNKKKKETSLSCGKGGITLVLSSSMSQKDIRVAVASVSDSGYHIKNIFGRGITTVTGMLARSASDFGKGPPCDFLSVLEGPGKSKTNGLVVDPIVLYVNFVNDKRSNGAAVLDAALIVCESGKKVKNNLGYERLSTLAVANQEGDGSMGGLENVLKDLLNIAQISQVVYDMSLLAWSSHWIKRILMVSYSFQEFKSFIVFYNCRIYKKSQFQIHC
jgi:hypothetical protein